MTSTDDIAGRVGGVIERYRESVIDEMRRAVARSDAGHFRFIRYHLGWEDATGRSAEAPSGKLLRPALCLLCSEAVGGDAATALPAAAAIELLHNFTLIHDDIEDRSETRHGRPTLWTLVGTPQAINAGDGLFVLAQRTLLDLSASGLDSARVLKAARILDDACIRLCEGQYADIGFEERERVTRDEYEAMIAGKTSALLGAAAAIGALAGGADDATVTAFERAGVLLGLAFQVQDDVLGVWGESAQTGKPVGDDIRSRKKSFPIVHAWDTLDAELRAELEHLYAAPGEPDVARVLSLLDAAGAREAATSAAESHAAQALDALRPLDLDSERRHDLEALATFFVRRSA